MTLNIAKLFFTSVILSDILYASNSFQSSLTAAALDKLIRLTKRGVRCVMNSSKRAHTAPLFAYLSLLPLPVLFDRKLLAVMYRCVNETISPQIACRITPMNRTSIEHPQHSSRTRGEAAHDIRYPLVHTQSGQNRPLSKAVILCNKPCGYHGQPSS